MRNFKIEPDGKIPLNEGTILPFHQSHAAIGIADTKTVNKMLSDTNGVLTHKALSLAAAWQKNARRPSHLVCPLKNTSLVFMTIPPGRMRSEVIVGHTHNPTSLINQLGHQSNAYVWLCDAIADDLAVVAPRYPDQRHVFVPRHFTWLSFG